MALNTNEVLQIIQTRVDNNPDLTVNPNFLPTRELLENLFNNSSYSGVRGTERFVALIANTPAEIDYSTEYEKVFLIQFYKTDAPNINDLTNIDITVNTLNKKIILTSNETVSGHLYYIGLIESINFADFQSFKGSFDPNTGIITSLDDNINGDNINTLVASEGYTFICTDNYDNAGNDVAGFDFWRINDIVIYHNSSWYRISNEVRAPLSVTDPGIEGQEAFDGDYYYRYNSNLGIWRKYQEVGSHNLYTHTQSIASDTWTVNHNLNTYPSITVVDDLGNKLYANEKYIDENTIEIKFSQNLTGKVYLNY